MSTVLEPPLGSVADAENPLRLPLPWDVLTIQSLIPHRYPFLLLDRITELDMTARTIAGYKLVSTNEPFFQGHFPERPIMPGVLQVEALAQLGCVLSQLLLYPEKKLGVLAGLDNVRFRRLVIPGDRLDLFCEITKFKSTIGKGICRASVNGETALEAEILFSMVQ
jgi:3-hydroxyacyl-[acyl-carrier-protein] dehydratase